MAEELTDDLDALLGRLTGAIDRLGHPLTEGAVMVDEGLTHFGERQSTQLFDGGFERDGAVANAGQQVAQAVRVERHATHRATGRGGSDSGQPRGTTARNR